MGVVDWGFAALIVAAVAFLFWVGKRNAASRSP
jgi:hypothetical protein